MDLDKEKQELSKLVNSFARAMKRKLFEKLEEGFEGWKEEVPDWYLIDGLLEHVKKGPVGEEIDIANIAMFIWRRKNVQQGGFGS